MGIIYGFTVLARERRLPAGDPLLDGLAPPPGGALERGADWFARLGADGWTVGGAALDALAAAARAPRGRRPRVRCALEFPASPSAADREAAAEAARRGVRPQPSACAAGGLRRRVAVAGPDGRTGLVLHPGRPALDGVGESYGLLARADLVWLDAHALDYPQGGRLLRQLRAAADAAGRPCALALGPEALRPECRTALLDLAEGAALVAGDEAHAQALLGQPAAAAGRRLAAAARWGALLTRAGAAALHRDGRRPMRLAAPDGRPAPGGDACAGAFAAGLLSGLSAEASLAAAVGLAGGGGAAGRPQPWIRRRSSSRAS